MLAFDDAELQKQLAKAGQDLSGFDASVEAAHTKHLLQNELVDHLAEYDDPRVEGVGGSGIVISAVYVPFGVRRAIKLPRARLYGAKTDDDAPPRGDPEIHALSKASHKNITKLYISHKLRDGLGHCVITEYVTDAHSLSSHVIQQCCSDNCRRSDSDLRQAIIALAQVLRQIIEALQYLHENAKVYHFDVKPDNLLVSGEGIPYVTDLGFARDFSRSLDSVEVGFTYKYAHPRLWEHALVTQTSLKAKNTLQSNELSPAFDLFAFGRTLQEVLKILEDAHGEHIYSFYAFNYLHVLACMCLDGMNARNGAATRTFVSDTVSTMPPEVFRDYRFRSFDSAHRCIDRLLGLFRLEDEVPELDRWSPHTINVSDLGVSTLTPRVRALIEHPALLRLAGENQLGMLDTIYPTANHTRLQHTLGVFHAATEYVIALYYDPDNPLFRALVTTDDFSTLLVAALIHDIGQTSFGHEMEEVDETVFHHVHFVEELTKVAFGDSGSLHSAIERDDETGWGIDPQRVFRLLRRERSSPMDWVLSDILDSEIDADKLDYLIRDSVECRVPYGSAIDPTRLVRSLTIVGVDDETGSQLRLAVKRKGAASAEAFGFARYQLYQSVYWHHTFRAIKAMFFTSAALALEALRAKDGSGSFDRERVHNSYKRFVLGIGVPSADPSEAQSDDLDRQLASSDEPPKTTRYGSDATMRFLWKLSADKERQLLSDIIERRYYKRVFEVSLDKLDEKKRTSLMDKIKGPGRLQVQTTLDQELKRIVQTAIQDESRERASLAEDRVVEAFSSIASSRHCFLIDLPTRGWFAGGDAPRFVSDFQRRHFRAPNPSTDDTAPSGLWAEDMGNMMRRAAYFRVFCEPTVHSILTRVAKSVDIRGAVFKVFPEVKT